MIEENIFSFIMVSDC